MNIILEGPDAAGKTLYANKLTDFGFTYCKCSPGEHAEVSFLNKDYFSKLLRYDNYVFDRFFISELVFSELYDRKRAITFDEVNKLIANNIDNIKLIILYASDVNTLKERCRERNELEYIDELDTQNKLFIQYAWIFDAYESENIFLIDVSKYNTEEAVNDKIKAILGG